MDFLPVGTWLSLVEHSLGVRGVGSSNLPVPTITFPLFLRFFASSPLSAASHFANCDVIVTLSSNGFRQLLQTAEFVMASDDMSCDNMLVSKPPFRRTKGYGDVASTTSTESYTAHFHETGGYCGTLFSRRESTISFASPKLQP